MTTLNNEVEKLRNTVERKLTPKPPMVVWLGDNLQYPTMTGDTYQRGHWSNLNKPPHHFGPYVHLDQFMAEVERRLGLWRSIVIAGESEEVTDKHFKQAALMVAKEIKEQQ